MKRRGVGGGGGLWIERKGRKEGRDFGGERETFELIFIFSWYQVFFLGMNSRRMVSMFLKLDIKDQ